VLTGAALGELVLGKKMGNKAMFWGAVASSVPDLDMIAYWFYDDFDAALIHRGFTHSLLFCIVIAPLLGYLVYYNYRSLTSDYIGWTKLFLCGLLAHIGLDYCTAYGTQLLWPFSNFRFSNSNISVFDPFFTLPLLILIPIVLMLRKGSGLRKILCYSSILLSFGYMAFTIYNNQQVLKVLKKNIALQNIQAKRYFTTPTIGNNLLWNLVAETNEGFYAFNYSILDKSDIADMFYFPKNNFVENKLDARQIKRLKQFTTGFIAYDTTKNKITVNDFRFGRFDGYHNSKNPFIFSFELNNVNNSTAVKFVPPPRDFNTDMIKKFYSRMLGDVTAFH